MSPLTKNDLRRIFEKLDKNGDGLVGLDELNCLLDRTGVQLSLEELESLVGTPCLGFDEFIFFYDSISNQKTKTEAENDEESDIAKAFKVFDLNGDGFISSEELQSVLVRLGLLDERSGKDCTNMIYYYDTNMDGMIDFQEFKNMMFPTIS
ncbi:hypothetical protein V6N13_125898 [Hibiscus sabdariffa]|uniref:EF-hand domain-containing protein n=1 Tax=Hibiscus sabdariffa TaxID=183260 RepID=A0ABR2NX95_9ROSI